MTETSDIPRPTYDAETLTRAMRELESHYGMTSDKFYTAHLTDNGLPPNMRQFDRHVWASFYEDVQRLRESEPSGVLGRVERVFASAS
jgi:hypothetical protein